MDKFQGWRKFGVVALGLILGSGISTLIIVLPDTPQDVKTVADAILTPVLVFISTLSAGYAGINLAQKKFIGEPNAKTSSSNSSITPNP